MTMATSVVDPPSRRTTMGMNVMRTAMYTPPQMALNVSIRKLRRTRAGAQLHVCRTVCRRAERRALEVEDVSPEAIRYLNRLSDLLFILARAASEGEERLWQPGEGR